VFSNIPPTKYYTISPVAINNIIEIQLKYNTGKSLLLPIYHAAKIKDPSDPYSYTRDPHYQAINAELVRIEGKFLEFFESRGITFDNAHFRLAYDGSIIVICQSFENHTKIRKIIHEIEDTITPAQIAKFGKSQQVSEDNGIKSHVIRRGPRTFRRHGTVAFMK